MPSCTGGSSAILASCDGVGQKIIIKKMFCLAPDRESVCVWCVERRGERRRMEQN